jgi:hypothetical protein
LFLSIYFKALQLFSADKAAAATRYVVKWLAAPAVPVAKMPAKRQPVVRGGCAA